jgi:RimJ/RimL family protein N-acetyltransferase
MPTSPGPRRGASRRGSGRVGPWRTAANADLATLFSWYQSPDKSPFFVEIAGPTPSFDRRGFDAYCHDQSLAWVREAPGGELDGLVLLTYIQPTMRCANLDWRLRAEPDPGSDAAVELGRAVAAACAQAGVKKAQLLALAGQERRIALAESLGLEREGTLAEHFYHASAYHDLVMLGWAERIDG